MIDSSELPSEVREAFVAYERKLTWPTLEDLLMQCELSSVDAAALIGWFRRQLDTNNPGLLSRQRLAHVLFEAGHLLEARYHITACLEAWPSDARSLRLACLITAQTGDRAAAINYLLQLRKLEGRHAGRMVPEAAVSQRFRLQADWDQLGDALVEVASSERLALPLAIQIAIRESNSRLACLAARRMREARPFRWSRRQSDQLEQLVRRRLLAVLSSRQP